MPSYKDPICEIEVDGVPWKNATHGGVVTSIEIIDEDGAFLTAKVTISGLTVDEMGSSDFRAGVIVKISLGYTPDGMFDWGVFKMMKPQYSFGPQKTCSVILQGQSGESGASMAQSETHETWNNKTVREIVQELADRYGFETYFGKYDNPPVLVGMEGVIFKNLVDEHGNVIKKQYVDPFGSWRTSPAGDPMTRGYIGKEEGDTAQGYSGLGVDATMSPAELESAGYGYETRPLYDPATGVPALDTPMESVSTNGKSHWEFLQGLAHECGNGRYIHVANGRMMFAMNEPIEGHSRLDPDLAEPVVKNMENYLEGGYAVRRKDRTSPGNVGLHSEYYKNRSQNDEDRLKGVDNSMPGVGPADDPYFDGRSPLVFLWEKDCQDTNTFPIMSISITENFKQKGGKTSGSLIDEDSKSEITKQKEPEPDNEYCYALLDEGLIGKFRESFAGVPMLGFSKIDASTGSPDSAASAQAIADRHFDAKMGAANSVPSTREGINAQKSEYQSIVNSMNAGTVQGGSSDDPSSANAGEPSAAEKAGAYIDDKIKSVAVKFKSETDDDGFMAGLFGGTEDELERNVKGTADANQYGVFIEFSTFGIPGLYARSAIEMQNLSRWSGATVIQRIEHTFNVSQSYRIKIKARAPGTFAPSGSNAGDNADPDNLSPEDAQAQSANPGYMQLFTYDKFNEGYFESRTGNIEDEP